MTTPYSAAEAIEFIETLLSYEAVVILPISQDVPSRWLSLLKTIEVRGPRVFDLQIAATMLAHGVTKLFTYNPADFKEISEIQAGGTSNNARYSAVSVAVQNANQVDGSENCV